MPRSPDRPRSPAAAMVHAAVDRLVLETGEYAPLELLLALGRLDYAAYEAWREGAADTLDGALMGRRERIGEMLATAAAWAGATGLVAAPHDYDAWGPGSRPLRLSAASDLDAYLRTHYVRAAAAPQLDLFLDGAELAALEGLRRGLGARDAAAAGRHLERLLARDPGHRLRADAERLHDALVHLAAGTSVAEPEAELRALREGLAPAARRVLGAAARDFLSPFWRRLAAAVAGAPFDPARAELHPSWLLAQCPDWAGVRASLADDPALGREPVLLERMAGAELRLGDRVPGLAHLAALCWRFPDRGEGLLESGAVPDAGVRAAWEAFSDLECEPPLEPALFPAWLLVCEPGLARHWPAEVPPPQTPAAAVFRLTAELVRAERREEGSAAALAAREALAGHDRRFLAAVLDAGRRPPP